MLVAMEDMLINRYHYYSKSAEDDEFLKKMNELFDSAHSKNGLLQMTIKQILVYAYKMLKPFELSVKSYTGASYNKEHLYDFELIMRGSISEEHII